MPEIACVNGQFMPLDEAVVPIEDRGYQFADGVYEVLVTYGGKPHAMESHLRRLERSLTELMFEVDIGNGGLAVERAVVEGIARAGYAETFVYLQITRGVAPRRHQLPDPLPAPTVVMTFKEFHRQPEEEYEAGIRAITTRDLRWRRCDVKSVSLLPNILAQEEAARVGASEALLVDEAGRLTEGATTSCFRVSGGELCTTPPGNHILPSVTRGILLELAEEIAVPVREAWSTPAEYLAADELFIAGTGLEVMPVVALDGHTIGEGRRGPVARRLREAFLESVEGQERVGGPHGPNR